MMAAATHIGRVCERCGTAFLTRYTDIFECRPCHLGALDAGARPVAGQVSGS